MQNVNNQLMHFQESFMELLYAHDDLTIIQEKLSIFYDHPVLANWLKLFDLSMLEVAARMTQHWGKKA